MDCQRLDFLAYVLVTEYANLLVNLQNFECVTQEDPSPLAPITAMPDGLKILSRA